MTLNTPGQLAPHSQDAEAAVIGSVLVDPAALLVIAPFLQADDFFITRHGVIWQALLRMNERGERIDYVTVQEELRASSHLDDIGGGTYLLTLVNATPTSLNAVVYGQLVHRTAQRRRLLRAADEIRALALDENLPMEKVGVDAWQRLERVNIEGAREVTMPGSQSIGYYDQLINDLAARRERGELVSIPLPEDWHLLKKALPAFFLGNFGVVSGASGSGKSAWLEGFGEHCAQLGIPTEYIHTEMSTADVLHRRMVRHSGVSFQTLASGDIGKTESGYHPAALTVEAAARIGTWAGNLTYQWMPDVQFSRLQLHLKRAAMMGVKVFLIDHFQDIVPPDGGKNGNEIRAVERMVVWLNAFAELRNVLVLVGSQLNDQGKVKWSRKLVEKAVVWINLERKRLTSDFSYLLDGIECQALTGEDNPRADVYVNKARFGKKAKVPMLYHGPGFAWVDHSRVRTRAGVTGGKVVSIEELQQQAAEEARKAGF